MCKRTYLVISGVIFALGAIGHLARLAYHLPVQIGEWTVPMSLSGEVWSWQEF